jgi:hypothetical protein
MPFQSNQTIVGSNLQANANNAVNTANTNNGQININSFGGFFVLKIVALFLMRGWSHIFTIKG